MLKKAPWHEDSCSTTDPIQKSTSAGKGKPHPKSAWDKNSRHRRVPGWGVCEKKKERKKLRCGLRSVCLVVLSKLGMSP